MDWARVMRGMSSMAKEVSPASAMAWSSSPARWGSSIATSTAPAGMASSSAGAGRWTLRIIRAPLQAAAESLAMAAPAALKAASV